MGRTRIYSTPAERQKAHRERVKGQLKELEALRSQMRQPVTATDDGEPIFAPLPPGQWPVILADPPWRYKNWSMGELAKRGEKWARRNGRSPYPVVTTAQLGTLLVPEVAAKDCALFLWATFPKLLDAFQVIEAWGFTYKAGAFTWAKQNPKGVGWKLGTGYWTRANTEVCLLATRGRPKRISKSVSNLIVAPLRGHSQKPDETRERIERLVAGPYLELFARPPVRPGWTAWGNEITLSEGDEDGC